MLDKLVSLIYNKNDSLDSEMNNIQTVLSARQIAKFILWIDQNPVCMQMLEALWPHITLSSSSSIAMSRNNSVDNLELLAQRASSSSSTGIDTVRRMHEEEYSDDFGDDDDDDDDDD